ncbi:MAG: biotin/lipoyl-binding protein [Ruminiclostridium sp.]|nr:biotin/lipoyl-binding protein [Ruminiclostridium sp.]
MYVKMAKEITLPKLGVTMEEGMINKWYKKEGDYIKAGDIIYEIETDKTSMEVESKESGYLKKIVVKEGESIPVTTVIAILGEADEEIAVAASGRAIEPTNASAYEETINTGEDTSANQAAQVMSTPRARKIARENGIDISKVNGTGSGGRITEDDVTGYLESIKLLCRRRKTECDQS